MINTEKMLELILLEKATLQRWLQELETREALIRKWIEQDSTDVAREKT